jgi:hypothetical protein
MIMSRRLFCRSRLTLNLWTAIQPTVATKAMIIVGAMMFAFCRVWPKTVSGVVFIWLLKWQNPRDSLPMLLVNQLYRTLIAKIGQERERELRRVEWLEGQFR